VTFSSGGFDTSANGYTFTVGPLTLTATSLGQSPAGLGVCPSEAPLACAQVDRVGSNEFLRIELPSVEWSADSVIVGLVNALSDDFSVLGSNTAIPTSLLDLTLLLSGSIASLGSDLGSGFWDIPINAPSGFQYLFFTTTAADNGYSLFSLTASPIPEPGTLLLFATGVLGFCVCRRRRKVA
jgi:hypothetical protein